MKSLNSTKTKQLLLFIFALVVSELSFGQTSINAIGTPLTQNFNTLTTSYDFLPWFNDSTLTDWYAATDGTSTILEYTADDGTYIEGAGLFSYGAYLSADRAFGYFPSDAYTGTNGEGKGYIGWRLKNNTGQSITAIKLIWTGEQWRKAVDANIQYIKLSYQIGTTLTDLVNGTYIETTSTFASPIHDANTASVLDGNATANRTTGITFEVNIDIPSGSEIMLRWDDVNDVANHTLAIDDVSFTAKESQTITFNSLAEKTYGDANFDLSAIASSGLSVTYTSSNPSVATVIGSTVTVTGAGITTITAKQSGNETYAIADSIVRVLNVKPQAPVTTDATDITVSSFQANWNSASGAQGYYLYYGTDPTLVTYTGASVGFVTTFEVPGLLPNTVYYYRTKSINTGIYSDYSNIVSLTTSIGTQTNNLIATPSFSTSNLSWTNGNLTSRAVFMKEGSGTITTPVAKSYTASTDWNIKETQLGRSGYYCIYYGTNTSISLTNLYPGKLYTVQAFEFTGTAGKEVFLTTASGVNNPITFSTWGTTTWTNTTEITTTENFTTAARWDHATVPTAALHPAVKVFIDGNCEVTTDAVASNVTINATHDAINPKLTINTGASLMVSDTLTNLNGASAIILKSGASVPNGTLIFRNAQDEPVSATVEMYSKASKISTTYKWQFFGIPVRTFAKYPTYVDGVNYVRKFNEAGTGYGLALTSHWIQLQNGNTLSPFIGYEVTQSASKTYVFTGELVNSSFDSGKLPYTYIDESNHSQYPGQHLIGNPYTAAINIRDIEFGSPLDTIIENSVYLYNTGSLADWTAAGSGSASVDESSTPGQYIVIPKNVAGRGLNIPGQIPSMQAFLVKVKSDHADAWVKIPYPENEAGTSLVKNTTLQRTPSVGLPCTRIDVKGANFGDRMWIFTEPTCSRGFDNGWDGTKEIVSSTAPVLFAMESSGNYQVNSVDNIHDTKLAFFAGGGEIDYTFTFTHQNNANTYPVLYLFDADSLKYTDITESGTQVRFKDSNTQYPQSRFKIVTEIDQTTETSRMANSGLKLHNSRKTIFINNSTAYNGTLELFDVAGRIVQTFIFNANATTKIPVSISSGSYIVKARTMTDEITQPIIIR